MLFGTNVVLDALLSFTIFLKRTIHLRLCLVVTGHLFLCSNDTRLARVSMVQPLLVFPFPGPIFVASCIAIVWGCLMLRVGQKLLCAVESVIFWIITIISSSSDLIFLGTLMTGRCSVALGLTLHTRFTAQQSRSQLHVSFELSWIRLSLFVEVCRLTAIVLYRLQGPTRDTATSRPSKFHYFEFLEFK